MLISLLPLLILHPTIPLVSYSPYPDGLTLSLYHSAIQSRTNWFNWHGERGGQ